MNRLFCNVPKLKFGFSNQFGNTNQHILRGLRSVPSLELFRKAVKHHDRIAVINNTNVYEPQAQTKYTYADLLNQAEHLATHIQDCLVSAKSISGTISDDPVRIAVLCQNGFDYVRAQYAVWQSKAIFVPLCTTHPAPELEYVLRDSDVSLAIVDQKYEHVLKPLAEQLNIQCISLTHVDPTSKSISAGDLNQLKQIKINPQQGAMIIYTSGTTGRPKGVVTTHANIEAQIRSMIDPWKWTKDDHILHVLPLHHVHGVINILGCALWSGAICEMMPKFDSKQVWHRFLQQPTSLSKNNHDDHLNLFMAVPTIYSKLISDHQHLPDREKHRALDTCRKKFRLMVSGSMALPESIMKKWEEISGHRLLERYGMTEIGMALSNPLEGPRLPGSVGLPLPGVEVKLVHEEKQSQEGKVDEILAQEGDSGELRVRGPSVFSKYWRRPEATKEAFDSEGFFKTGDIVMFDPADRVYRIMGRASVDIIKSGGYKISALDIERELLEHPLIDECAVVGIKDEEWGQQIGAIVVLKKGSSPSSSPPSLDITSLRDWARDKMASYKLPKQLLLVDSIPRNAMGKVNKKELVKLFST